MVQGIETIVVGYCQVSMVFKQQGNHIIPFFADGIMQWGVTLRILNRVTKHLTNEYNIYQQAHGPHQSTESFN
jgi:hypothetical protein